MAETIKFLLKRIGGNESAISIEKKTYTFGRLVENNIICSTSSISRKHCTLFRKDNDIFIQDLKSGNGTFLNGKRIKELILQPIKHGDIIGIGTNELVPTDLTEFVYRLHKQVEIDLESDIKTGKFSQDEEYCPPNKLVRFIESETSTDAGIVVSRPQQNNITPTMKEIATNTRIKICVNSNQGLIPNIFLNEIPISHSSSVFNYSIERPVRLAITQKAAVEKPKESVQHEQEKPDITNAENNMHLESLSATIDIDSGVSMSCTSMTKTKSQSNPENKAQEQDFSLDLKSSRKPLESKKENIGSIAISEENRRNLDLKSQSQISEGKRKDLKVTNNSKVLKEERKNLKSNQSKVLQRKENMEFKDSNTLKKMEAKREDLELQKPDQLMVDSDPDESLKLLLNFEETEMGNVNVNTSIDEILKLENVNEMIEIIEKDLLAFRGIEKSVTFQETTFNTGCSTDLSISEEDFSQISSFISDPNCGNFNVNSINEISYSNFQYPYPVYPNLCQNNQSIYQNCQYPLPIYPNSQNLFPDFRYPPPVYQNTIPNYLPQCMPPPTYNIPPPSYVNQQIPIVSPAALSNRDPRTNRQPCERYPDDTALPSSFNAQTTSEDKINRVEDFSATWNNQTEEMQQIEQLDLKSKKSMPTVISSERVNLPYKSLTIRDETVKKNDPFFISKSTMKLGPLDESCPKLDIEENNNLRINDDIFEKDTAALKNIQPDVQLQQLETHIPEDKRYMSTTKSDQVLMNIVSWKPAEFESCFSKDIPHVLDESKLRMSQSVYSSHDDYCQVLMPLILIHISYEIKNAYKDTHKKATFTNCEVVKNSASIIWIKDAKFYMMGFQIRICESKANMTKPPVIGDFLRIDIATGKTNFRTLIFAYIAKVLQSEKSHTDSDLLIMTFQVVTKLLEFNLYESKIREISVKMSLLPSINLIKALDKIKESPLLSVILNPNPKNYILSSHLDPGMKQLLQTSSTPGLLMKENLNYMQLSAVRKITDEALKREAKVALIEGPPGTGKTKVITNIVIDILNSQNTIQEKDHPMKILICAESDSQIDEILSRICDRRKHLPNNKILKMVRVGFLDQMSHRAKDFSLQELAKRHIETSLKEFCAKDLSTLCEQQLKFLQDQMSAMQNEIETKKNSVNAVFRLAILSTFLKIKQSGRQLRDMSPEEYVELMEVGEQTVLLGANVIVCTLKMCYSPRMDQAFRNKSLIPVLIVEDASQTLEHDLFKPLTFGVRTLVLAGDSCKRSMKFIDFSVLESHGFSGSLFSRLKKKIDETQNSLIFKFRIQYRMNRKIAFFPNKFFHGGRVKNEVESGKTFPLNSYRIFNLILENPEENQETFVSNLIMGIMLYAELKNAPKPLKIGIVTNSESSRQKIIETIANQLDLISVDKKNLISVEVNTISRFKNQERDVVFAFCPKPKNGQRVSFIADLYRTITLAKHSLFLYGTFNKFEDEKTSMWNALVDDGMERKMLFNIDPQDLHHSKLKNYIIRNC